MLSLATLGRNTRKVRGPVMLALLSAALFGSATPLTKTLLNQLRPFQLAGLLYLGAAIGVLPFAWKTLGDSLPSLGCGAVLS